jgi:hypothetical protein
LFCGSLAAHKYLNHEPLSDSKKSHLNTNLVTWRGRLGNLSWFMRTLNEYIARKANAEDQCTGHFWEARFKSQALLDETALLTAMAYVDLNPIRADIAKSIQDSDFTSAQDRWRDTQPTTDSSSNPNRPRLLPFIETEHQLTPDCIPFNLKDYLDLLDTTGRVVVEGKRGFIPQDEPKLLHSLNVNQQQWLATVTQLQQRFELAMGNPENMIKLAKRWGKRWLHGIQHARRLYPVPSG